MRAGKNRLAALAGWPEPAPDWVLALADEADRTSQVRAGERLGLSASAVNSVIRGRYGAKTDRVEQAVRGRLMDHRVACPELGPLAVDQCQEHQDRAGATRAFDTGSFRVRMRRACLRCPHGRFAREE